MSPRRKLRCRRELGRDALKEKVISISSFIRHILATSRWVVQQTYEDDYGLTKPPVLAASIASTTAGNFLTFSQQKPGSSDCAQVSAPAESGSSSTPTTPSFSLTEYQAELEQAEVNYEALLRQRYGIAQAFADE